MNPTLTILGAGAWGTALAVLVGAKGVAVKLWARRPEHAQAMSDARQNSEYLPGLSFPPSLVPTANMHEALAGSALAIVAVPSKALHQTLQGTPQAPAYVSLTKGLHFSDHGLLRMSQVIAEATGVKRVAVLSGPNLAEEIARGLPAAAVVAAADPELAQQVQGMLAAPTFRVYTSSDVVGVELGGALKNVIALAAGMVDGLGLGDNTKAALITRGLREIVRFGEAMGGEEATFFGLSGLGDLVATASSPHSRNRGAGERLVRGETLANLEASKQAVEGIYTVKALHAWSQESGTELPITEAVYRVVYERSDAKKEITRLMSRASKAESKDA
jgi:glycerol-3-phosphate dehydrogenase (NAD(P)+)